MSILPDVADLEALRAFDTPTICNALDVVAPDRRAFGFNRRPLVAPFAATKPVAAFARTATIRSREPDPRGAHEGGKRTIAYYEHIAEGPTPSIAVIQDLDGPDAGLGAFWGEVNSNIHKGLGCAGVITDGAVRDLDVWAKDFFVLAGSIMPSHVHVHVVEVGTVVSVAGMIVAPNDVVHADRHGAVVVPAEVVKLVPAAADLIARREKVLIDASKSPGFSIDRLRQAFAEMAEIH
jgi:regulator of RNase E activity RraA